MLSKGTTKIQLALLFSLLLPVIGCEAREQKQERKANLDENCFSSETVQETVGSRWGELEKQGLVRRSSRQADCNEWRDRALIVAIEFLSLENGAGAKEILDSFNFPAGEKESERLFYLYYIAKFNGDRMEMTRIATGAGNPSASDSYGHLMQGIEKCLLDQCGSAVSNLEAASKRLDFPLARGYLAAAYAHSGRLSDAEREADAISAQIDLLDEYVLYIAVAIYVQRGRIAEARTLVGRYFAANPDLDDSPFLAEAKRLVGVN